MTKSLFKNYKNSYNLYLQIQYNPVIAYFNDLAKKQNIARVVACPEHNYSCHTVADALVMQLYRHSMAGDEQPHSCVGLFIECDK